MGTGWSVGLSDAVPASALVEGGRRAARARELGEALGHPGGGPRRYADVEIYDALIGDLDGARAARVEARTLGRLSPELVRTLDAYLQAGSSVTATARALFLHRNTVHYRLRRIEERTGLDLARMEHRMLFELGLLARRLG
jgi:DNA-binding PucR family transcriptional regulator